MAEQTPDWHNDAWKIFWNYLPTMHVSGVMDNYARSAYTKRAKKKMWFKLGAGGKVAPKILEGADLEEEVKLVFDETFLGRKGIAELGDQVGHNLLYNKEPFEQLEIPHEKVSTGAYYKANNYAHKKLHMGIQKGEWYDLKKTELTQEEINRRTTNMQRRDWYAEGSVSDESPDIMSTKLDEDLTRGLGLPEMTKPELKDGKVRLYDPTGGQDSLPYLSVQDRLMQQTLDDIMAGNAQNIYTALMPASEGGEGYYIGIFYRPVDKSSGEHKRIGAMRNPDGTIHIVSNEELVGASASNQILEYLASWWFDYNHENVMELYNKGQKGVSEGPGRAVPRSGFPTDIYTPMERAFMFLFTDMGELEFKYAVEPLYLKLEDKAKEIYKDKYEKGKTFLNEEQSQDVLREFADTFNRSYKETYEDEPFSYLKGAARWVTDFWEFDFNLREIWN